MGEAKTEAGLADEAQKRADYFNMAARQRQEILKKEKECRQELKALRDEEREYRAAQLEREEAYRREVLELLRKFLPVEETPEQKLTREAKNEERHQEWQQAHGEMLNVNVRIALAIENAVEAIWNR